MWPRGGKFKRHPVEIRFGRPIHPNDFMGYSDPYAAVTDALKVEIQKLAE
jgi:hypothetical protein